MAYTPEDFPEYVAFCTGKTYGEVLGDFPIHVAACAHNPFVIWAKTKLDTPWTWDLEIESLIPKDDPNRISTAREAVAGLLPMLTYNKNREYMSAPGRKILMDKVLSDAEASAILLLHGALNDKGYGNGLTEPELASLLDAVQVLHPNAAAILQKYQRRLQGEKVSAAG